jgi:hypothetical protein
VVVVWKGIVHPVVTSDSLQPKLFWNMCGMGSNTITQDTDH